MKLRILFIFIFSINLFSLSAQEYFKPELYIGARGAYTLSQLRMSPKYANQEFMPSIAYGVSLVYYSSYYWGIKWGMNVEFNHVTKGWKDVWSAEKQTTYERYMTYWDVPIFTQASFGTKNWRYIVSLGPFLNFMSGGKETLNAPEEPTFTYPFYYGRSVENKFQFGIGGGVGVAKTLPFGKIQVEARMMQSLLSMFDFDRDLSYTSQHQNFEFSGTLYITILKGNKRKKQKSKIEEEEKNKTEEVPFLEKNKEDEKKEKGSKNEKKKDKPKKENKEETEKK